MRTDEHYQEVARIFNQIFRLMAGLDDKCPYCGKCAYPLSQVGHSVYGKCGCRLFLGRAK